MSNAKIRASAKEAMNRAVAAAGSKAAIAEKCRQPYQAVDRWCRTGQVPARHCIPIEEISNGAATRYELRPDVFGAARDEKAA